MGLLCLSSFAQDSLRKFNYGLNAGLHLANISVTKDYPSDTSINSSLGYRIGLYTEFRIAPRATLTPRAEVAFQNLNLKDKKRVKSPILRQTIDLSLYTNFYGDSLDFAIFFGPNFKIPGYKIAKFELADNEIESPMDCALDFGLRKETKRSKLTSTFEIRYSLGIINLLKYAPTHYKYSTRNICLVLGLKR